MSIVARRRRGAEPTRAPQGDRAVRWPNLYLVGAAKAGTTSLWWYLDQHPAVFMSPTKEPHFFSQVRPSHRLAMFYPVVSRQADYLALFASAGGANVVGESSTSYLWSPGAAARIHEVAPDAHVVILLRDPVERAWSHYWNDVAEGFERRGFLRAVRDEMIRPGVWGVDSVYLSAGFYADAVARYFELFGRERVHVSFFETFIADPRATIRDLFAWLGVDPGVADRVELEPQNAFKRPRNEVTRRVLESIELRRRVRMVVPQRFHPVLRDLLVTPGQRPVMDDTVRALLRDLYASDVDRLSDLLGIIPPWDGDTATR